MAAQQPPDVGKERVEDGKAKHSIKDAFVNPLIWKFLIGSLGLGYKVYKIVAKETDLFE